MEIRSIEPGAQRAQWMELLLENDPHPQRVERYLQRGILLAATEEGCPIGALSAVFLPSGGWEVKNLSVAADQREKQVDKALLAALEQALPAGSTLWIGAGRDGVPYYQEQGFHYSYTLKNFSCSGLLQPAEQTEPCGDLFYLSKMM